MKFLRIFFLAMVFSAAVSAQVATITPSANGYVSGGGSITFSVRITYTEPTASVGSVGISLRAPTGWSFASVTGPNQPQAFPPEGNTGGIDFAYTSVPASPISFSFTLNYAAALSGDQVFTNAECIFRSGGVVRVIALPNITIAAGGTGGTGTSPVAPAITAQPASVSVSDGQGASFSVSATGTAPLSYQWRKDGTPVSGATNATLNIVGVSTASVGVYSVVVSNAAGSVVSLGASLAIKTTVTPPQIITQPRDTATTLGAPLSLSVSATGTAPLSYQWRKDGAPIISATGSSLSLAGLASDAGNYSVLVSNAAGSITSSTATVTISSTPLPVAITTQPIPQTVVVGGGASFSVVASGTGPLTYQWQKDGVAIVGATASVLNLSNVGQATAGSYRVMVSGVGGNAASISVTLTIVGRSIAGTYLGSFENNGGTFGLQVRADRTGVLLGYASASRLLLLAREIAVGGDGTFVTTQPDPRSVAAAGGGTTPPIAAHEGEFHISGTIGADGSLTGTVSGLNLTFTAPSAATTGPTATMAGFYQSGEVNGSGQAYIIVSPAGQALVVNVAGLTADGGIGAVATSGVLSVTTATNATVSGSVSAETGAIVTTVISGTRAPVTFVGANNSTRTDVEKLVNISTRSRTGTAANTLIAGFVISGDAAKPVLIRAIGPTLGTAFGVGGSLAAARLEIFRGQTLIAVGDDWSAPSAGASSVATIAATAARVGAFALPANSRDAALLLTLEPAAYTVVVTGQGGVSGVSLVEVYDATEGAIPRERRIINIATRATAGTGDNALIAGFYVSGVMPKRLLIRGVGPTLEQFGVGGVLSRPQLTVQAGATVIAQNAGWSTSPDAVIIATSSTQVGAFAFPANSLDAAIVVNLAPGAYTAQVDGVGNTSGVALVEVYELP